jgi:hypothetical protein
MMKSYDLQLEDDLAEVDREKYSGFLFSLPFWIVALVLLARVILSFV